MELHVYKSADEVITGLADFFVQTVNDAIAAKGELELGEIAGGIYTKMVTSATGLIIGLLAYVAYNFLNTQVDKTANRMEMASSEFIDVLQEPTR